MDVEKKKISRSVLAHRRGNDDTKSELGFATPIRFRPCRREPASVVIVTARATKFPGRESREEAAPWRCNCSCCNARPPAASLPRNREVNAAHPS